MRLALVLAGCLLAGPGCESLEPAGKTLRDTVAPIVREVAPAPWGEVGYYAVSGIGLLLLAVGGVWAKRRMAGTPP